MTPFPSTLRGAVATPRGTPLDETALTELVAELLATRRLWEGLARFDPRDRWPVRLIGDAQFEAWVIGWCAGQALGLHDHGDSAAAVVVADGRLHETTVAETERGPRRESCVLD